MTERTLAHRLVDVASDAFAENMRTGTPVPDDWRMEARCAVVAVLRELADGLDGALDFADLGDIADEIEDDEAQQ